MAAYINEIYFDPPASSDPFNEYIELRGTPNMSLNNFYLVFLENENNALNTGNPGAVERYFDFTGQSFGSNGFLTLRQKNNPYSAPAPGTTDLVNSGSSAGWGSGDSSSLLTEGEDPVKLENSGFTAFLIQTDGTPGSALSGPGPGRRQQWPGRSHRHYTLDDSRLDRRRRRNRRGPVRAHYANSITA